MCFQPSLEDVKIRHPRLQKNVRNLKQISVRAKDTLVCVGLLTTQCASRFRLRLSRAMCPSNWHASFSKASITLVKYQYSPSCIAVDKAPSPGGYQKQAILRNLEWAYLDLAPSRCTELLNQPFGARFQIEWFPIPPVTTRGTPTRWRPFSGPEIFRARAQADWSYDRVVYQVML